MSPVRASSHGLGPSTYWSTFEVSVSCIVPFDGEVPPRERNLV